MVKATQTVNYFREAHGIPALKIDAEKAQEAQDFLVELVINKNKKGRRRLEGNNADNSLCG